jgi:hypothetical protein
MAAPAALAQLALTFTICSFNVVGMPAAVALPGDTLVRISLRTMPDKVSAFAVPLPLLLVPSPGYGPPVSSGMTAQVPVAGVVVVVVLPVLDDPVLDDPVLDDPVAAAVSPDVPPPPPQPASGTAAADANSQRSDWRRLDWVASMRSRSSARL